MNNNKTFEEEKIRLKKVIKLINKYIEESNLKFNEQKRSEEHTSELQSR